MDRTPERGLLQQLTIGMIGRQRNVHLARQAPDPARIVRHLFRAPAPSFLSIPLRAVPRRLPSSSRCRCRARSRRDRSEKMLRLFPGYRAGRPSRGRRPRGRALRCNAAFRYNRLRSEPSPSIGPGGRFGKTQPPNVSPRGAAFPESGRDVSPALPGRPRSGPGRAKY